MGLNTLETEADAGWQGAALVGSSCLSEIVVSGVAPEPGGCSRSSSGSQYGTSEGRHSTKQHMSPFHGALLLLGRPKAMSLVSESEAWILRKSRHQKSKLTSLCMAIVRT